MTSPACRGYPMIAILAAAATLVFVSCTAPTRAEQVKLAAANISTGNRSRWLAPAVRLMGALQPTVIAMQEVRVDPGGYSQDYAALEEGSIICHDKEDPPLSKLQRKTYLQQLGTHLGRTIHMNEWPAPLDEIDDPSISLAKPHNAKPNAVAAPSDWQLVDSGRWQDSQLVKNVERGFAFARFKGVTRDLMVVSVHFLTEGNRRTARRPLSNTDRAIKEAEEVVQHLLQYYNVNTVDEIQDYVAIAGDFNHAVNQQGPAKVLAAAGFAVPTLATSSKNANGETTTNNPKSARGKQKDIIVTNKLLAAAEVPTVVEGVAYRHGYILDTKVQEISTAGLYPPTARDCSRDVGMQHMAVMRTFEIDMLEAGVRTVEVDTLGDVPRAGVL